jgi:uncharacterized protein YdeI (YjbR/CyaY-like superfamily)
MQMVLSPSPIKKMWEDLTPLARCDFIAWVTSAKQTDTRARRIASMPSRLTSGKRRPCCYAIVPAQLYKAIGTSVHAKRAWSNLDPMQKRAFASWVRNGMNTKQRQERVERVVHQLQNGVTRV